MEALILSSSFSACWKTPKTGQPLELSTPKRKWLSNKEYNQSQEKTFKTMVTIRREITLKEDND